MQTRWKQRPPSSTWGDFGPDDQIGRLNLLTPEKVKQAVAEVREGLVFCLSLPLDYPGGNKLNPRRHAPRLAPTYREDTPYLNFPLKNVDPQASDVISDDQVTIWLQYSTQWDSLAHVGSWFDADADGVVERVYYNGYRADEHVVGPVDYSGETPRTMGQHIGARALGIENYAVKGIQGRGVMVDLHAHFGDARVAVGYDDLMRVLEADRVAVEPGDLLCLHTGFSALVVGMERNPDMSILDSACACLDGRDEKLLGGAVPREAEGRHARGAAAPRALPLQARRAPRRAVVDERSRRLATRERPEPLPAHRPAATTARRGRLAGDADRDRIVMIATRARPRASTVLTMGR